MARYKPYDLRQSKLIPLCYSDQLVPGSFEHALNEIVEEHLDMSVFDRRYRNDATGRLAYDPKVLLKIVLYGYSKGLISSRDLDEACKKNVVFMALSDDTRPHWTTIASFVSRMGEEVVSLFTQVLFICDEIGLLGRKHFALDGCRLSSNASKEWSGTHEELLAKKKKMQRRVRELVSRHRERDEAEGSEAERVRAESAAKKLGRLRKKIKKLNDFLATAEKKVGPSGKERKTNVTDPESAKMASSHGVIQGYNGMAVVDDESQIVVAAEAHGTGQEHEVLMPMVEAVREGFCRIGDEDVFAEAKLTADAGLHSSKSMEELEKAGVDAYIADPQYRRRDERFAERGRYKERHNRERRRARQVDRHERERFGVQDFIYSEEQQTCICPAGHSMYRSGLSIESGGYVQTRFKAPKTACRGCPLRSRCLRYPERTEQRQVAFFIGRAKRTVERPIDRMRRKLDSLEGREIYGRRLGTVEPVFGNVQMKGMTRFALRGKRKVDTQWKLYMLVPNIEKIARSGKLAA